MAFADHSSGSRAAASRPLLFRPFVPVLRAVAMRLARRGGITVALEAINLMLRVRGAGASAGRGVVFTLHHVRPNQPQGFDPNRHLSITPEFLDAAIVEMLRLGYQPVALDDVPARLAGPDDGTRFFAVTLDDGNRDNARFAAPVFRAHGVPYTVFATKGLSERTSTMWWETVAELIARRDTLQFDFGHGEERVTCASVEEKNYTFNRFCRFVDAIFEDEAVARINELARRCGVDPAAIVAREIMTPEEIGALAADPLCSIGAHTVTHCDLARATPARLDAEITQSIDAVERWTGKRPTSFAYPYGFARVFGAREQAAVNDAGIRIAVTTRPGVLTQKTTGSLMAVPRVSLNGYYQNTRYVRALASGLAFRFMK